MEPEMITTSRSAVSCYQQCPRKRWHQYESPNGTPTPGWERKALAIPLVTGIYVHKGLEAALTDMSPAQAASYAATLYREEVEARGIMAEIAEQSKEVVDEQAAHVEALVLAWCRVRLPVWQAEYEVVEVEVEDRVALSDDVTLAVRADAIVRRKYDHRMFVVNFKTVGTADERWLRAWEVDMQLMTELLAAERRHGHEFGGVIIEGLIKGRRMPEKNNVGDVIGYRDSSPLIYGYKHDADPPLAPLEYGWEYTRRKGWYRFPVWKEPFQGSVTGYGNVSYEASHTSPVEYWINWLPSEVVEAQFTVVPPIMRDEDRIKRKVEQIITMEHRIADDKDYVGMIGTVGGDDSTYALDRTFPQNEHSCTYPSRCPMYDMCYTGGVADDPAGSGLYVPRKDHHAIEGGE